MILPASFAVGFAAFCAKNPAPCPLLFQSQPGQVDAGPIGATTDVRTDLPLYRVYRHGKLEGEVTDLSSLWRDDLVCFYIGCSFTFESALIANGVPVRNVEQKRRVSRLGI